MSLINWLFEKADPILAVACERLAVRAKSRRNFYSDFDPYLTRLYFTSPTSRRFGAYLHYHHPGEPDLALHNHPFGWSCNVVLTNGYLEELWDSKRGCFRTKLVRPGSISVIRGDDFHRLMLINRARGAWTLFLSGQRIREAWGFWWPTGVTQFVPHFNFHRSRLRYAGPN